MTTPSVAQWKTLTQPLPHTQTSQTDSIKERQLMCLATYVTGQNPDGTARGT